MNIPRRTIVAVFAIAVLCASYRAIEAKDEWVEVRSKNFLLLGNASEKEIRRVGTRLEQFRETFRLLFANMNLASPIPTNVIVFKNSAAYKDFKPKRADGTVDTDIAGFFQSGEDVNYITLAAGGDETQPFSTIFHEYVHYIVNTNFGKTDVPAWFNEGLAQYYETFAIEGDQKVKLGLPQNARLPVLRQNDLIPLDKLFNTTHHQLLQTGGRWRNLFYAESWALVHYLIHSGKADGLSKFMNGLLRGVSPERSFQDAFGVSYLDMETALTNYIRQNRYKYHEYTLATKLVFDTEMQTRPLDEAVSSAYLGDLLYHNSRSDDAEPYLAAALKVHPESSMANTTMGMVKLNQRRFDEAKTYFEKAISGDMTNHVAYYRYAFLLSREGHDEFGYVERFEPALASKMRDALRKAISINPAYTESYELLAFVDIVNNEELEDAVTLMQAALTYRPGNQRYSLRIAEIYSRQNRFAEALQLAERLTLTADDPDIKNRAGDLLRQIHERKAIEERNAEERRRFEEASRSNGNRPQIMPHRIEGVPRPSDAEIQKAQAETAMRTMNEAIREPLASEQRVLGRILKIDCKKRPITFVVDVQARILTVSTADFGSLSLNTFDAKMSRVAIGCDTNISDADALITYKPKTASKDAISGELIAIEFVPPNFRIMTDEEMRAGTLVIYDEPVAKTEPGETIRFDNSILSISQRRSAMMQAIRDAVKKPAEGQKQEIGFLDKIECTDQGVILILNTATGTLRLLNSSIQKLAIRYFTPDLSEAQFGCGIRPIEFPAVFIYTDKPNTKSKTAGEITALDFVPKSFVLETRPN